MASLCVTHCFHFKNGSSIQELQTRRNTKYCRRGPRFLSVSSCRNNEQSTSNSTKQKEDKGMKKRQLFSQVLAGVEKFGRGLKENMSPKQKGDWKDVMLMSLSFAVYVYMSQMIVCAYCSWMSMPQTSW